MEISLNEYRIFIWLIIYELVNKSKCSSMITQVLPFKLRQIYNLYEDYRVSQPFLTPLTGW